MDPADFFTHPSSQHIQRQAEAARGGGPAPAQPLAPSTPVPPVAPPVTPKNPFDPSLRGDPAGDAATRQMYSKSPDWLFKRTDRPPPSSEMWGPDSVAIARGLPREAPPDAAPPTDGQGNRSDGGGDFALPEGLDPASPGVSEFKQIATELRIDPARATKMLEMHRNSVQRTVQAISAANVATWEKQGRGDPEIGGAKFDDSRRTAVALLARVDPEMAQEMERATALHPRLLRAFVRLAALVPR